MEHNYFIHYGGAGLNMFQMVGYDHDHDSDFKRQSGLGIEFDNVAKEASISALMQQVPRLIYSHDEGVSFGELFTKTCNTSSASATIYREAIGKLIEDKIIEVIGYDGTQRRSGQQVKAKDQILPPRQRGMFFFED